MSGRLEKTSLYWGVPVALVALMVPLVTSSYLAYLINLSMIYSIAIIGMNILMGLGGQIFFGAMAMMAIGAYCTALLIAHVHLPFFLAIPLAALATAVLSLTIILPALRLRGLYLAMVSVGFHLIVEQVIGGWGSLTGGYDGFIVSGAELWGFSLTPDKRYYYVILLCLGFCLFFARNLMKMRAGRAIWSVGQDPVAASVMGLNVTLYKVSAFLICAVACGLAGGLLAVYLRFITPDHFTLNSAIMLLVGMIIGGWGSIFGSIVGGFFVTFLPEVISFAKDLFFGASTALYDLEAAISGIVIIVVILFIPHGFSSFVKSVVQHGIPMIAGRRS